MASADKKTFEKSAIVQTDSASLIALASEVAKHDERFQRQKGQTSRGGIKAPKSVKKPTVWQRQNPGLSKRAGKYDVSISSEDPEGENARKAAMERKAKIYEMLKRGEDVPDKLRDELLVEFEYKDQERALYHESDESEDEGRSRYRDRSRSTSPRRDSRGKQRLAWDDQRRRRSWSRSRSRSKSRSRESDWDRDSKAQTRGSREFKNDPWIEHVDEFGRTRLMRQSEIPKPEPLPEPQYTPGIHNPANPFPVFRNPDAVDKQEWIQDATGEMKMKASQSGGGYSLANTVRHYDNTTERRARGVGFYAFSQDEDERQRQMKELLQMRSQV
ncbi:hypothetical protein BGZ51_004527 [Haplosporangium sp. Z 767]|nr:hypothetical protein BGZ51_004527 [Haplosporangium sp. Z 767]